jgi:glycosyltransferase involved in cell wall biosynthesis
MPDRLPSICFVAPNAFPLLSGDEQIPLIGGAELQQVMVAKGLVDRGYRVSMICLDFGQEDEVKFDGITVFRAFRPDEGIPVLRFVWPRLTDIWACLSRAKADIYYQRAASMLTGVMAAFCKTHSKKSIFAAAGNPNFERNTSRIRFRRDRWIYEYGLRNVDCILVQNIEQARLCRDNFNRESVLVPNCYQPPMSRSLSDAREILWVSTVRRLKRPELFLDLAEALPQHKFKMVGGPGAGAGEWHLFEAINARAKTVKNVEFLGFVPPSKIDTHFDSAALFVNTSESEGFPNTFLQSWAHEIPTVSFVDCGARVDGRPVGRTVQSMEEMIGVVTALMSDEETRAKEGEVCRGFVERYHSLERILDLYETVFGTVLSE